MLPLVPDMKVMVTENIAFSQKIVHGTTGIVEKIIYDTDSDDCHFIVYFIFMWNAVACKHQDLKNILFPLFLSQITSYIVVPMVLNTIFLKHNYHFFLHMLILISKGKLDPCNC